MPVEPPSLASLLALTDAVQEAIDAGEWTRAAGVERQRRALLEAFLSAETAKHGGLEHTRPELVRLQERNNRLIGELFHHQRRLTHEAGEVDRGRRAMRAYQEHGETQA